jgi:hypothetical protein
LPIEAAVGLARPEVPRPTALDLSGWVRPAAQVPEEPRQIDVHASAQTPSDETAEMHVHLPGIGIQERSEAPL